MYDRIVKVRYADQWWNKRNPAIPAIDFDCISQCLPGRRCVSESKKRTVDERPKFELPNNNQSYDV